MGIHFNITSVAELEAKAGDGGGELAAVPAWYVSMVKGNPGARGGPAVCVLSNGASVIADRLFPAVPARIRRSEHWAWIS